MLSNQKYVGHIVSFDDFFIVQGEKAKRSNLDEDTGKRKAARYSSQNVLSGLLVCAECGASYRRITRPSGEVVWRCASRVEHGKEICKNSPSLAEVNIKNELFRRLDMKVFNDLKVAAKIDSILIGEAGMLKIEYKSHEFHQIM